MTGQTRLIAAVVLAGAATIGSVLAQGGGTPVPQGQAPTSQAPTPPAGRGTDPGQRGADQAGRQGGGGGRRGGFTQFTRELAPQDVLVRGKSLYEANCASCHASDLRGSPKGANLLRSGIALSDQHGELVGAAVARHHPAVNLVAADSLGVAEYIHSILATTGGQGSPPGRNPEGIELNLLVGDPKAGATYFATACSTCHSVTGDLKGVGSKYEDVRALQNAWVAGSSGRFGGGGRGSGGVGNPATVTMADGSLLAGTLVRKDDFLVILALPDGTRKSMARINGTPKVDVTDPNAAHKKMVLELDDPQNKNMHDVTAYLWTIK
jgi:cytochrome c oxidase cbb3-type subunit 3